MRHPTWLHRESAKTVVCRITRIPWNFHLCCQAFVWCPLVVCVWGCVSVWCWAGPRGLRCGATGAQFVIRVFGLTPQVSPRLPSSGQAHSRAPLTWALAPLSTPPHTNSPALHSLPTSPAFRQRCTQTHTRLWPPWVQTRPFRTPFSPACRAQPAAYYKSSPYDLYPCVRENQGQQSKTWGARGPRRDQNPPWPFSSGLLGPESRARC